VKTQDPLRSGGDGTFGAAPEGVVLEPSVCLSVGGEVLVLAVKLLGGHVRDGGVHILVECRYVDAPARGLGGSFPPFDGISCLLWDRGPL
jgi:hypothetical protein